MHREVIKMPKDNFAQHKSSCLGKQGQKEVIKLK